MVLFGAVVLALSGHLGSREKGGGAEYNNAKNNSAEYSSMEYDSVLEFREYGASQEVLFNPLIGYVPQAEEEHFFPESTLVYVDVTWRELEPEEGEYQFEQIEEENHLEQWRQEGKHAVLRFLCDYPEDEEHMDIPDWLYEKIGGAGTFYDMEYGKGFAPDYNNETLICCHERAIKALGEHFAGDSFIAYVELGSLGHWGEWHVNYRTGIQRMPQSQIRSRYVEAYEKAFPQARFLMRRPFKEMPEGFGLYNDMTGDEESTREWLEWMEQGGEYGQAREKDGLRPAPRVWEQAPVGGEFTSGISMEELLVTEADRTRELLSASHMSFIGPKIPDMRDEEERQAALDLLSRVGYRYRITSMSIVQEQFSLMWKVLVHWTNDGTAPIYWPWQPCLYVTVGETCTRYPLDLDLTALLPGETAVAAAEIPEAILTSPGALLWAGIENPETGEPQVYLGMEAERMGTCSLLWRGREEE